MKEMLLTGTFQAIRRIEHPRFWRTERGFHGEFHSILRELLWSANVIGKREALLEQEYQKRFSVGSPGTELEFAL